MDKVAIILSGTGEKLRNLLAQLDLSTRREVARLLVNALVYAQYMRRWRNGSEVLEETLDRYPRIRRKTWDRYPAQISSLHELSMQTFGDRAKWQEAVMLLEQTIVQSEQSNDATLQAFLTEKLAGRDVKQYFEGRLLSDPPVEPDEAVRRAVDFKEDFEMESPLIINRVRMDLDAVMADYAALRGWPKASKNLGGYDFYDRGESLISSVTVTVRTNRIYVSVSAPCRY